jgi:hypothetical protein
MNKLKAAALATAGAALLTCLAVVFADNEAPAATAAAGPADAVASQVPPAPARPASPTAPYSIQGARQRQAQLQLWKGRLIRAVHTLSTYQAATRYPHEARPLSEHPDQLRPFDAIAEVKPLRMPRGEAAAGVHLRTTQERVFASGKDSVKLTVSAVDDDGRPLPLLVTQATAFDLPDPRHAAGRPQVPISFVELGDGSLGTVLQPATQGFADFSGTIRVQVYLNQGGRPGNVYFDVIYQPEVPAEWDGVREALQDGSLDFYLKVRVARAGRYVVSARVDDAGGRPFALLSYNEEVAAGEQEIRLHLFGKLVRDGAPAFPLALRDIQGFLLLPDRFPDRAMMPRWPGVAHTSKSYLLTSFSGTEWQSEERDRYLAELGKDVQEAQREVDRLQTGE